MLSQPYIADACYRPIPFIQAHASSVPDEILLRFKRRDIGEIIRNASSYPEYFAHELLDPIIYSNSERLQTTVLQLSQRVSELMGQMAPFESLHESPEIVLRTPGRFFRLMESLKFMDLDLQTYINGSTLDANLIQGKDFEYAKRSYETNERVLQVAERLRLSPTESLQEINRQIFPGLGQFSHPLEQSEETYLSLKRMAELCTASVEQRYRLYAALRKTIRSKAEYLKQFVGSPSFAPKTAILDLFPSPIWESGWIQQVMRLYADIEPYLAIVQMVEEFLQPYLNGTVIAQSEAPGIALANTGPLSRHRVEDIPRAEVEDWLPAQLLETFSHVHLPERRIKAVALTAYLHFGSRGVHFGWLKGSYAIRSGGEDVYRSPYLSPEGTEYHEQRHIRAAMEIESSAIRIQDSFTRALQHALPIDFPSLGLTDYEIKALAHAFLSNPEVPLPEGWDEDEALKEMVLFPKPVASHGHKFPWD